MRPFAPSFVHAVPLAGALALFACDETPRGDQGIDFLDDGGIYDVPLAADAGPDALGPCTNAVDSTSRCASASENGIPYVNLVECAGTAPPAGITCASAGSADGGLTAYCCSTGIL